MERLHVNSQDLLHLLAKSRSTQKVTATEDRRRR